MINMKKWLEEKYKILKLATVVLSILVVFLMVWYILATIADQQNALIFTITILVTSTLSSLSWFILTLEYLKSLRSGRKSISSINFYYIRNHIFLLRRHINSSRYNCYDYNVITDLKSKIIG